MTFRLETVVSSGALRELITFALVGVVNTVLCLAVIWGAGRLGAGPYVANAIGYAVGLTNSFVLNRTFTFRQAPARPGMPFRFLIAFAVAYVVNLGVLTVGLGIDPDHAFLWQLPAMVAYTLTFFALSKWFVFR